MLAWILPESIMSSRPSAIDKDLGASRCQLRDDQTRQNDVGDLTEAFYGDCRGSWAGGVTNPALLPILLPGSDGRNPEGRRIMKAIWAVDDDLVAAMDEEIWGYQQPHPPK